MKESSAWPSNVLLDDGNVTDAYGEIEFIGTKDQTISKVSFVKILKFCNTIKLLNFFFLQTLIICCIKKALFPK